MGMPPDEPGRHSTVPPRTCGGNLDCKELVSGSTLWLPIAVDGALFSCGDGHAAQGDGEVAGTAIECPMERAELTFGLEDRELTAPLARGADGAWMTFGLHEDLDEAAIGALDAMLALLGERLGLSRRDALAYASVHVDLRVTQIVNLVKGVHAHCSRVRGGFLEPRQQLRLELVEREPDRAQQRPALGQGRGGQARRPPHHPLQPRAQRREQDLAGARHAAADHDDLRVDDLGGGDDAVAGPALGALDDLQRLLVARARGHEHGLGGLAGELAHELGDPAGAVLLLERARNESSPAAPSWPRISTPPTMIPAPIRSPASTQTRSSRPSAAPHQRSAITARLQSFSTTTGQRSAERAGEVELVREHAREEHGAACPVHRAGAADAREQQLAEAVHHGRGLVLDHRQPLLAAELPHPLGHDPALQVGDRAADLHLADVDARHMAGVGAERQRARGAPARAFGGATARRASRARRARRRPRPPWAATGPVSDTSSVTRSGPPARSASRTR